MSRWQTAERVREVHEHLGLRVVFNPSTGTWFPGLMLRDRGARIYCTLSPLRFEAIDAPTAREAERLAERAAEALGDVRPWMALFRCFCFRDHVRRTRRAA